jgi:hypothetical protein
MKKEYPTVIILTLASLVVCNIVPAQVKRDSTNGFRFSGTITLTSNGISPIPAFSLGKPAFLAFLSMGKKRFSYDPQMAFSYKGVPWFFNNALRYKLVDKRKFLFRPGLIWGLGYSYPLMLKNGSNHIISRAERYLWFESTMRYVFSSRVAISSTTYSGHGFEHDGIEYINFASVMGNFTKIPLYKRVYFNFFPQVFYLNMENESEGFFTSGIFGLGYFGFPVTVSVQMNETIHTNLSPDPGFKWNISLNYDF